MPKMPNMPLFPFLASFLRAPMSFGGTVKHTSIAIHPSFQMHFRNYDRLCLRIQKVRAISANKKAPSAHRFSPSRFSPNTNSPSRFSPNTNEQHDRSPEMGVQIQMHEHMDGLGRVDGVPAYGSAADLLHGPKH
jgi:hypothetical protein